MRFWQAVYEAAASYDLADIKVSGKYDALCNFLADTGLEKARVQRYDNRLYVLTLSELPEKIDGLRGSFGMFFQCALDALDELAPHITKKVQTAAVCGVERKEITDLILRCHLRGIDRVVFPSAFSCSITSGKKVMTSLSVENCPSAIISGLILAFGSRSNSKIGYPVSAISFCLPCHLCICG